MSAKFGIDSVNGPEVITKQQWLRLPPPPAQAVTGEQLQGVHY